MSRSIAYLSALLLAAAALGAVRAGGIDQNLGPDGLALKGYDPVAYFTVGQATPGSPQFTATYRGATYRFASAANRDAFQGDPSRYAPQFGGYCAMGAALGRKIDGDPKAWNIVGGKLYLNLNKDVQNDWLANLPGNLKQAEGRWDKIKDVPTSQRK